MIRLLLVVCCVQLVVVAPAAADWSYDDLRSEALRENFDNGVDGSLQSLLESPEGRARLVDAAFLLASADGSIEADNPAYLWSLAVDLYNSLPWSVKSGSVDGYDDTRSWFFHSVKFVTYFKPATATSQVGHSMKDRMWQAKRSEEFFGRNTLDRVYAQWYMSQNIKLLPVEAGPILAVEDLNIRTPTHYREFANWMAQMATAIARGVPPDQAEQWTEQHKHEWESETSKRATSNTDETDHPRQLQPQAQQKQPTPPPDNYATPEAPASKGGTFAEGTPWGVIALTVLAVVAVLAALRHRKSGGSS